MVYQSLYRRYRPRRFSEVRGQDAMVAALRNAVRDDRVGHAYLFSGPRGTGKTTTARILAKALNCEKLDDGEPCGACESCLAIDAGASFDLHELDAASNRRIDDIRDLLRTIALGTPGRTKVYLVDEVHMLTREAEAALLKTLEEPPPHVVFVLATTDPQKVAPTIRSRTQHFDVHLLSRDDLRGLVEFVIDDAGLTVSSEGIDYAIRAGAGSARDTLSALEKVVAAGGAMEEDHPVAELVEAIASADVGRVLVAVAQAVDGGHDPDDLARALVADLRNAFLVAMGVPLLHAPEADVDAARERAKLLPPASLTRALEVVGEALVDMRQSPDSRIPFEVALVRLARPDSDLSLAALDERLRRLERGGVPAVSGDAAPPVRPEADTGVTSVPASAPAPSTTPSTTLDVTESAPEISSPKGGRARPADGARAELARTRQSPMTIATPAEAPTEAPKADAAPPSAPRSAARPALGAHRGRSGGAARGETADSTDASPADEAPAVANPAAADGDLPDRDELTLAWGDTLLAALSNRARSRFAGGRFARIEGGRAVFALPNTHHVRRCEDVRDEVEDVLAAHFGRPVPIVLEVDGDAVAPADEPPEAAPPSDDVDDVVGPIDELADAGASGDVVERFQQLFPGTEEVPDGA